MRLLLFVLVMANVAYFAWQNYFKPAPESRVRQISAPVSNTLPTLVLLSEAQSRTGALADGRRLPQGSQAGLVQLGGFLERARAEELRQRLLSLGVDGQIVQKDTAAEQEYWVYMPPLSSRAATLRLLKELQARKLDGFLITQGELSNGISLGIFPHENSAEAILERLQIAGYQAQIKKISRKQSAYWFEISREGQRLVDEKILEALLQDFPSMQYSQGS